MKYFVAVQCREPLSGKVATYLFGTEQADHLPEQGTVLSPLFSSLSDLLPWMEGNAYRMLPMGVGEPWQAVKTKSCATFCVVPSRSRHYGYCIQAPPHITWALGPGNSFGWFKRKSDARQSADVYNATETHSQTAPAHEQKGSEMMARNGRDQELFRLADAELADLSARMKREIERRTQAATTGAGSEIVGLEFAKRVVTVAVAGNHSVLFVGGAGSGKTLLRSLAAHLGLSDTFEARPCPCGNSGDVRHLCCCTQRQVLAQRQKWPPADIFCEVVPPSDREFRLNQAGTSADEIRRAIDQKGPPPAALDAAATSLLSCAVRELGLRPHAVKTVRQVAGTIAALDQSSVVTSSHLNEAVNYRMPD